MGTTRHYWPMCSLLPASVSVGTIAMSTATTAITATYAASVTGLIDRILVSCATVATPPVYSVNIETVSAGVPTGTLVTAGATQTFTPTGSTIHTLTLGTPASVTRGQLYAVTLRYSSGTIGASNRGTFRTTIGSNSTSLEVPGYKSTTDGTSWSLTNSASNLLCPIYSDGSHEIGCFAWSSASVFSFGTSNVTDFGCRFTAPMSCSCIGALIAIGAATASAPRTIQLLNTSGTVLASVTQNAGISATATASVLFGTPASITDGTDYRLVATATTSTAQSIGRNVANSAAGNSSLHGNCYHTERSAGTWTDNTAIAPLVVPLFASPTSSSSGSPTVSYYVG